MSIVTTPGSIRFPEDGSKALEASGTALDTSFAFSAWFPLAEWPACAAWAKATFKAGSAVTGFVFKLQAKGDATGDAIDLRTTEAGADPALPTTTAVEHTLAASGALLLQTTDHVGAEYVRIGYKITGGPGAAGDAVLVEYVKGLWS